MKWLKHAFAIETESVASPTEEQRQLIDRVCQEVVRRRMTVPALMMLEMSRPLNYISAQFLHFAQPFLAIVTDADGCRQFADFLERRGSFEYIVKRIESLDRSPSDTHVHD